MRTVELNNEVKKIVDQDISGLFAFIPVEERLLKATKAQCLSIFADDDVHHCKDAIELDIDYLQTFIRQ